MSATFNNQTKLAIVGKFPQDTFRFHKLYKFYFSQILSLHLDEERPVEKYRQSAARELTAG
jgi:hypothetical protein